MGVIVLGPGVLVGWFVHAVPGQTLSVCDRTVQVRDAIEAASGGEDCAGLTLHHLREITALDLSGQGIAILREGDFDGLLRLDTLDLSGNLLTSLPRGLFDQLYLLKTLRLHGNLLELLPDGIFDELYLLEDLTLHGNRLSALPRGPFDDFSRFAGMGADGSPPDNSGSHPRIRRFLDRHDVGSPEEFIAALPSLFLQRFVLVYQSASPAAAHVSGDHPRVISWGADGDFIFAWTTDPDAPSFLRESVEFLREDELAWSVGVIDFSGATPEITEPAACQACHGSLGKPLWGEWNEWRGTEYVHPNSEGAYPEAPVYLRQAMYSADERLDPLDYSVSSFEISESIRWLNEPGQPPHVAVAEEAGAVWSWRHAEVLFRLLRRRDSDLRGVAETLVCTDRDRNLVLLEFDHDEHNIGVSAAAEVTTDGDGAILSPDLNDRIRLGYSYGPSASIPGAVNFLIFTDLWGREPMVRHLYRKTSNTATIPDTSYGRSYARVLLHYTSGSATAEDEVIQRLRLHFGRGGRTALGLRARQNGRIYLGGLHSSNFWRGHVAPMKSRVCSALRESRPRGVTASLDGDSVALSWEAPAYDTDAITGYRILRSADGAEAEVLVADTGSSGTEWTDEKPAPGVHDYAVHTLYDHLYVSRKSPEARISVPTRADAAAPRIGSPTTHTIVEGETAVATLTATDEDTPDEALTWSISDGADSDKFAITRDGALSFLAAGDYEAPDDADGDGVYEVTVTVSDGEQTATANISVTLANRNEAPAADAGPDQSDIEGDATVTLSGTGTDPDTDDVLEYRWTQTAGTTVTLSSPSSSTTSFTAPADLSADEVLRFNLRVTDGGGLYGEDEVAVTVSAAARATLLTAWTVGVPARHDGSGNVFTFELHFSEDVPLSHVTLRDSAFEVTGGTVVRAGRKSAPSNVSWNIEVRPDSDGATELVLPANRACDATGAICTDDGRRLSNRVEVRVPGPAPPLTAWTVGVPARHDGSGSVFTFELHFSENVPLSYVTLRDSAFEVTGGAVVRAGRKSAPSNVSWNIDVRPDSNGATALVLPANRACDATGAICTDDGRRLSNRLEVRVPGPG